MYMKTKLLPAVLFVLLCEAICSSARAQLTVSAQLRTRTEFRSGQGAPLPKDADPAFFTSQRTRLNFLYGTYRLKLGVSVQDARVWGQDVSTINRTTTPDNNGLLLHEAWAEIQLTDTTDKAHALFLKAGRQELVYDDQRLIGNLDWLQQARRHDAAVLRYETAFWRLHAGAAFNQNKEAAAGTIYNSTPPGNYTAGTNGAAMYKSMEFLYAGRQLAHGTASFLLFADQFNRYHNDTAGTVITKTFDKGAWSRVTTGFYFNNAFDRLAVTAGAYYQMGKNTTGQSLHAGMINLQALYQLNKKVTAGAGFDYTSGGTTASGGTHAFDPLYGTPHKFWGLMDYFYAASSFGSGGLMDYYLRSRWSVSGKSLLAADIHQFSSATAIADPAKPGAKGRSFGQEVDLVYSYAMTPVIGVEAGYSHFFSTDRLAQVKNVANARSGADWAYLMLNIKPSFFK